MREPACLVTPGLHKRNGIYACAVGIWNPVVLVDPKIFGVSGEQALVAHELEHVRRRHALQALISAVMAAVTLSLGILLSFAEGFSAQVVSVLVLSLMHTYFYFRIRQHAEVQADQAALHATTPREFAALVYMHPHPTSGWGRWLYGNTPEDRVRRVLPL